MAPIVILGERRVAERWIGGREVLLEVIKDPVGLNWRANLPEPDFWTARRVGFADSSVLDGLGASWPVQRLQAPLKLVPRESEWADLPLMQMAQYRALASVLYKMYNV